MEIGPLRFHERSIRKTANSSIDKPVQPPKAPVYCCQHSLYVLWAAHVTLDRGGFSTHLADGIDQIVCTRTVLEVVDSDSGSTASQCGGNFSPDATGSAGDQRYRAATRTG